MHRLNIFQAVDAVFLAQLERNFQAGTKHHPLAVRVNITHDLRSVHAHTHPVHDQPIIIVQVIENPVDDVNGFLPITGTRQHDCHRTISGHVIKGRSAIAPGRDPQGLIQPGTQIGTQCVQLWRGPQLFRLLYTAES